MSNSLSLKVSKPLNYRGPDSVMCEVLPDSYDFSCLTDGSLFEL